MCKNFQLQKTEEKEKQDMARLRIMGNVEQKSGKMCAEFAFLRVRLLIHICTIAKKLPCTPFHFGPIPTSST